MKTLVTIGSLCFAFLVVACWAGTGHGSACAGDERGQHQDGKKTADTANKVDADKKIDGDKAVLDAVVKEYQKLKARVAELEKDDKLLKAQLDARDAKLTKQKADVARLLVKKGELERAREKQKLKLVTAQAEQVRLLDGINPLLKQIDANITDLPGHIPESTREDWLRAFFGMSKAVWGWEPPGGKDQQLEIHMTSRDDNPNRQGPTRRERSNAAKKSIADDAASIKSKASSIGDALTKLREQNTVIAQSKAEIDRLQTEIDMLTKEILSVLEQ